MYSGQGARFEIEEIVDLGFGFGNVAIAYTTKRRLNYLSVPLLANYQFNSGFFLESGLAFDFMLAGRETYEFEGDSGLAVQPTDPMDIHSGVDVKFALGAGYELASGLGFSARYSLGLGNNLDDSNEFVTAGDESFNRLFQLSVTFPLYGN